MDETFTTAAGRPAATSGTATAEVNCATARRLTAKTCGWRWREGFAEVIGPIKIDGSLQLLHRL